MGEQERLKEEQKKNELELKKLVDKHNNKLHHTSTTTTVKPVSQIPKPNMNKTHSLEEATVARKNDS